MDDRFETVAITYSQPEAAVMVSFLGWHDVDAYALSHHARVAAPFVTALGGIPVRVHHASADRARALLATVDRPPVLRPPLTRNPALDKVVTLFCFLFGGVPPPRIGSERL